jgi:hypothetical protein
MLEIADELAIRDLNARYIDAVNRLDAAAWEATWAEGARWRIFGTEFAGRARILEVWKGAMSQFDFVVMALNSGTLERRGDMVSGRWYVTEFLRSRDGSGRMVLGSYRDEYARESDGWKFSVRSYHVIHQGAFDLSGAHQPLPA